MNRKLKKRVQASRPTDLKASCQCTHWLLVHDRRGNCSECEINPRTGKSRCRRFKAA